MEGQLEVLLPESGLSVKAPDRHSPLFVRIASTRPHGTLTRYELRFVGHVPGNHDLREYLFLTNGQPATNLAPLPVKVAGILPTPHSGWLEEQALRAPSIFGGYRAWMAAAIALWAAALFVILRTGKRREKPITEVQVARAPTFAERLRPLIERAAAGTLSTDEQAALERMLITHWQRRLGLEALDSGELISRLREHPEAGALLRALEDWLHRPPGMRNVLIDSVLAPYRDLADEGMEERKLTTAAQ